MTLKEKIAEILKYNAPSGIWAKFPEHGQMIHDIVKEAERMDKELDIIHEVLTTLQNDSDVNYEMIKVALDKVSKLKKG